MLWGSLGTRMLTLRINTGTNGEIGSEEREIRTIRLNTVGEEFQSLNVMEEK